MALTDAKLRSIKPQPGDFKLADGGGLHLLVKSTGGKLWRLSYRYNKKQKTLALGAYPAVTLSDARQARDLAKHELAKGLDPAEEKKARRQDKSTSAANTFEVVANEWFDLKEGGWARSYSSRLRSRLDSDLIAPFGDRPIRDIQPLEVLSALRAIEKRGAIEMAKRIKQMASAIFCYAVATERCNSDPTASLKGVLRPPNPPKHRAALSASELPEFMLALEGYDGDEITKLALKLVVFTLVRTTEIRFGQWKEFENIGGQEPLWRIPKERMKMRRPHIVPLSPQAVEVLLKLRKLTGKEQYIVSAPTKTGVISENTMLYAIYRMGYHSRATSHGFRTTASSILNERQFNRDWIEMQLAHFDGSVRGIYNAAEWLPGRRDMMRWWGDFVEGASAKHKKRAA
ncbi:MAG TPA: integrase arm-type DNA-binding domain-containing protein [Rhizomicrobium sp.]